ncbi:MAG: hypothetical protein AAF640_07210, partial [Pseudomonadota bacterium]
AAPAPRHAEPERFPGAGSRRAALAFAAFAFTAFGLGVIGHFSAALAFTTLALAAFRLGGFGTGTTALAFPTLAFAAFRLGAFGIGTTTLAFAALTFTFGLRVATFAFTALAFRLLVVRGEVITALEQLSREGIRFGGHDRRHRGCQERSAESSRKGFLRSRSCHDRDPRSSFQGRVRTGLSEKCHASNSHPVKFEFPPLRRCMLLQRTKLRRVLDSKSFRARARESAY